MVDTITSKSSLLVSYTFLSLLTTNPGWIQTDLIAGLAFFILFYCHWCLSPEGLKGMCSESHYCYFSSKLQRQNLSICSKHGFVGTCLYSFRLCLYSEIYPRQQKTKSSKFSPLYSIFIMLNLEMLKVSIVPPHLGLIKQ